MSCVSVSSCLRGPRNNFVIYLRPFSAKIKRYHKGDVNSLTTRRLCREPGCLIQINLQEHHYKRSQILSKDVYSNRKRHPYTRNSLIDSGWLAHGGLDVKSLDVLPVLLKKRYQEVDRHSKVVDELIVVHVNVTDSNVEAKNLLHLELDGGLDFVDFGLHGLGVSQHGGELTGLKRYGKLIAR